MNDSSPYVGPWLYSLYCVFCGSVASVCTEAFQLFYMVSSLSDWGLPRGPGEGKPWCACLVIASPSLFSLVLAPVSLSIN